MNIKFNKNQKGYAIIDIIVSLVLVAAVAGVTITYVYKSNTLSMSAASCEDEKEFFSYAKACLLAEAHNKAPDAPTCANINTCLQATTPVAIGTPAFTSSPTGGDWSIGDVAGGLNGTVDNEVACTDAVAPVAGGGSSCDKALSIIVDNSGDLTYAEAFCVDNGEPYSVITCSVLNPVMSIVCDGNSPPGVTQSEVDLLFSSAYVSTQTCINTGICDISGAIFESSPTVAGSNTTLASSCTDDI